MIARCKSVKNFVFLRNQHFIAYSDVILYSKITRAVDNRPYNGCPIN